MVGLGVLNPVLSSRGTRPLLPQPRNEALHNRLSLFPPTSLLRKKSVLLVNLFHLPGIYMCELHGQQY